VNGYTNFRGGLITPCDRYRGWRWSKGAWQCVVTGPSVASCEKYGATTVLLHPLEPSAPPAYVRLDPATGTYWDQSC
jgi:hypothetical protein